MRPDLAKCIIEAPRRGSSARSHKVRKYGKIIKTEDGYEYEGLTRIPSRMGDDKAFSDKLGPLYGYLLANCGRPWNDVYSEISYHIGRFSKKEGLRHIIKAHMPVEPNTYRGVDGGVYARTRYAGWTRVDKTNYWHRPEFYVEPETGILRVGEKLHKAQAPKPVEVIPIEEGREYRKIKGIWYYQKYDRTFDRRYVGKSPLTGSPRYEDVELIIVTVKKQLNKKELRELAKLL